MKKYAIIILDKIIMALWIAVAFSVVALIGSLFYGGVGGAGWMGFVYVGIACLSFVAIRMLRVAQEWMETPTFMPPACGKPPNPAGLGLEEI